MRKFTLAVINIPLGLLGLLIPLDGTPFAQFEQLNNWLNAAVVIVSAIFSAVYLARANSSKTGVA